MRTTFENNLLANVKQYEEFNSPVTLIDYNQYQHYIASGCDPWLWGGGPCYGQATFAAWQVASSSDAHGSYGQEANTVNADGTLQAGSPAIGAGLNLTSLNITALDSDAAG